jgi:NADPH:quinone reductase-like Zn-dependent oxidoreductase
MATIRAAVVTSFDEPPHYLPFELPEPIDPDHELVEVVAVGLHPRVRTGASGRHYSSTGGLPMIPGVDGVGRCSDGSLVYFGADDDLLGSMADKTVIDRRRSIPLPPGVDVERIAAAMNPAMSSWVALRRRVVMRPGASVLVLGATGNAGAMAVQVAKHLGAGRVVGAGRDAARLDAVVGMGADAIVRLTDDADATASALATAAADVDIVIDYLWGPPALHAMQALLLARLDRSLAMDWIQIGSIAGASLDLPSVLLRAANLRVQGVGQGSVSGPAYLAELPSLIAEIEAGGLVLAHRTVPLRDIERVWTEPEVPGVRTVVLP